MQLIDAAPQACRALLALLRALPRTLSGALSRTLSTRAPAWHDAPDALRATVDLSADWYWETDAEHRLRKIEYSRHYRTRRMDRTIGRHPWNVPGTIAEWDPHRAVITARQVFLRFETTRLDDAGHVLHVQVSGAPVWSRWGSFLGYRGVGRDITAQKEAEGALNASEAQLAAIIDAAMDAVITVEADGRIVVFNETAGRIFGCSRADALGAPLERFAPQALQFIQGAAGAADGPPRVLARSLPLDGLRRGGEPFASEASISSVDVGGRRLYCVVLRDLSARVEAEEARQALEMQLRQSQKMEALGTMAGGIAHDFNNIVAAILGNAALAQANLGQPAARQFVGEITKAGLRARDIVQRIMAFSRNQPTVFSCQALEPLVEEGVQLLRAMLPSGIEVSLARPGLPLNVRADPTQISQVLMNLGTNAWQALGSRPGRIDVALSLQEGEAVLTFTDNGCGMDSATQQRIFEPFFTTKAKGEGTGLGLPVVHGIVCAHGGRISVHSTKGVGTKFEVRLPLASCATGEADQPAVEQQAPPEGRGRHVIYLDDYPAMVFMLRATLETFGFRVSGFEKPEEAMAFLAANAHDIDLVVTDHNMPGHSGLELAGDMHRLYPGLPVILASGYITDELRDGAARCGVVAVFDKPRGIEELCALIGRVLADAPPREALA